ncbi:gfo/Idh/MocA family oxidoreductase, partial [Pseudomonas syringae]|uniref:Gfo/Idh/MocA family protein n=1 Tax=Pseudomonas syringae TaxID=317 RepID=UPI001F2805F2
MRESLSTSPAQLGIGLIGTGFMGRAHALAFGNANAALDLPARIRLCALADADSARAEQCASAWGFDRSHADWQQLIDDPHVQIVAFTTPNLLHFPMALAPIPPCKAVSCVYPLAVKLS